MWSDGGPIDASPTIEQARKVRMVSFRCSAAHFLRLQRGLLPA
jgi:hypothetical protein